MTEQNFLELCTNRYYDVTDGTDSDGADTTILNITDSTIAPDVTSPDQSQCECQYAVFVDQMPINADAVPEGSTEQNFTSLNSQLKDNPTDAWATVSDSIKADVEACGPGSGSTTSTTAPSGDSTTTTAAETTSTTA